MGGFRVLLDLTAYFSDYRQKSWIYIDPNQCKTIKDLKSHICGVFSIEDDFEIFLCGSYVPYTECISIIVGGDVLEIQHSNSAHSNTLNVKEASICKKNKNAYRDETREDEEVVGEEKRRKKRKKRKEVDGEGMEKNEETAEMTPLPEDFHPEYNSTMTARKKKKSSHHNEVFEATMESVIVEANKDSILKKSSKGKEGVVEDCTAIGHGKGEESVRDHGSVETEVMLDINDDKIIESTLSFDTEDPKARLDDLATKSDSIDVSEITGDSTSDMLSSQQSLFHQSLLERTLCNEVLNLTECESDKLNVRSEKKRRRTRLRRKKHKKVPVSLATATSKVKSLNCMLPNLQSNSTSKSDAKFHMRFPDSDEDKEIFVIPSETFEVAGNDRKSVKCVINASKSISSNSQMEDLTGSVEKETFTKPADDFVKGMEVLLDINETGLKYVHEDVKVEEKHIAGDNSVAVVNAEEKVNGDCSLRERDLNAKICNTEVASPKTEVNSSNHNLYYCVKSRPKKAVISTGLGATLAHLLKDNKKIICEDVPEKKSCPSEPAEPHSSNPLPVTLNEQLPKNKKDKRYKGFPILEKYPRKGDILAFKILKLNQNYEPCISNYMEGTVTVCDKDQSWIKMKILEGASELSRSNGKFDLLLEEEDEKMDNKSDDVTVELQWKDLIEPRLVFP